MKIIKSYWASKEEQIISEGEFVNHIKNQEIKKVFIGFKEIKNFKIEIQDERMILRYALVKNASLKYYCNLLNHSIALNNNTAVFLQDKNYQDFKNRILTKETINILN